MVGIETIIRKIKDIKNSNLKSLQEYESLIISLYKSLAEFKRDLSTANLKKYLSKYLPLDSIEELQPLIKNFKYFQLPDLYTFLLEIEKRNISLLHHTYPVEFLKLINFILKVEDNSLIYNPFPDAYGFAYWFSKRSRATVITVDPYETEIPDLLNGELPSKIRFSFKDPLCVDGSKSYDYSISFVWKSERVSISCGKGRKVNGWKEILLLKHLISLTKKKCVVILPSSFLSRIRREFVETRKDILQYLESVILLPANIFYSSTLNYCILVFSRDTRFKREEVLFADLSDFYEISSFGMKNILSYKKIINVLKSSSDDNGSCVKVSKTELGKLDGYYRLHPSLYLKRNLRYFKLVSRLRKTIKLKKIADIIASPFVKTTVKQLRGKELSVFEIQITDIPENGIINKASVRKRRVFNLEEYKNAVIKPNDILLSVRGAIGKLGIVLDVPKDEIWVPSQTLVIIRSHYEKLDPHALFVFLRSELGQFLLERAKSGEVQDFISMKLLREMEIPEFSGSQQFELKKQFKKEIENYKRIDDLKEKIEKEREEKIEGLIKSFHSQKPINAGLDIKKEVDHETFSGSRKNH